MRTLTIILGGMAFLASMAVTSYLLYAPLYKGIESHCTEGDCGTIQITRTLVEVNGTWVIYQLVAVTLVSGVPLFVALWRFAAQRAVTWVVTLLLITYSIAGSFTIGLLFMPSAILLLLAAVVTLFIPGSINLNEQKD